MSHTGKHVFRRCFEEVWTWLCECVIVGFSNNTQSGKVFGVTKVGGESPACKELEFGKGMEHLGKLTFLGERQMSCSVVRKINFR